MSAPASPAQDHGHPAWDLARDRPDAYIPRDRRRALHAGHALPDRVRGAALFADISGFTPLTEALAKELGPQRGAEELTASIGRVFHAVIEELDGYDGNVIYFAGDAITCWIDDDDGSRACAAAMAMQDAIARVGTIVTPSGGVVQLAMKVAIAVGDARRFVVGDPDIQLIDVLAGRLMDDLAEAEHHAGKGEVVLDRSALDALGERASIREFRDDGGGRYGVLRALLVDVDAEPGFQPAPLPEDLVRPWLLPAVYERLRTGRGEFLAELRPAIPVFLRFGGIDYDNDDDAIAKLDDFVRAAQRVLNGFGGSVLQLTLGDKGAYLYGVFGSPLAHEDDGARAAAAALELRDLEKTTAATGIQLGMTQGRLRSGTYGHDMRRTFVCLGDAVNLAARLMSAAPTGRIYVSGPLREVAGEAFIWERLPDVTVKGKADPIEVWALNGSLERASRRRTRFELGLVGRRRELAELAARHAEAAAGTGRVVGIAAEAGMGKSRLVAEFVRDIRRAGHTVLFGECQAYGTRTPYFVWREIWRRVFGLEDGDAVDRQVERLERHLGLVDPSLVARAPLLSDVVGLSIPDNDLTRAMDAKLRKSSLEDLLTACLRSRAREAPLVAVLEDCHWIDELSRDLLQALVRSAARLPVLFVLAYRPEAEPGGGLGLADLSGFSELALDRMEPADAARLVRMKLAQLAGAGTEASDSLVDLIATRSEGNPFYVEELISFIVAHGVDTAEAGAAASVRLPESLHTLVLSRIDAAAEGPRRTMKVASVVGRVFEAPTLPGAYEELGDLDAVLGFLDALRSLDLVALDREAEQAWMFKHVVTQEVAYDSLPFALRALLHGRVGAYLEARGADDLDRWVPLLEHHYWRSDREEKKREYLVRAADAAQAAYANNAAIAYFDRLIPLLQGAERVDAQLKLAKVLELTGAWARSEATVAEARSQAEDLGDARRVAWCDTSLAEVARKQGRYDEAAGRLAAALDAFEATGADDGLGQVLHLSGTLAAQRGDYEAARERYLESLPIRRRLGDRAGEAALYSNLGVVADYLGDVAGSGRFHEQALEVRRVIGDRWAIGVSLNNLGMVALSERRFEEARAHFEAAMRLHQEVGDAWMVAIGHNNLGNANRGLGDVTGARASYAASLGTYRDYDDRWAMAFLVEDVAVLAAAVGDAERAIELAAAAETLREGIGAPRSPALAEELHAGLAGSRAALGDRAGAVADRGRSLDTAHTVEVALEFCSG